MPNRNATPPPPSPPQRVRQVGVLLLLTAALTVWLSWALGRGRPVPLPDVGDARLPCVSYAPFHQAGQTPFDPTLIIPPAQIEADLRRLATLTGCVRTYGLDHGLEAVPGIARTLGLRLWLGVWIGRDPAANAAQLELALALTRTHADLVDLLVVGNEVLLRRELSPAALADLLAQAKRASAVPVAYADVWEFWLRHGPVLRPHVDVVAAHILPYWEDQPVAVADAVDHVVGTAAALSAVFDPLPVYIAETGWPAAGRQRGPAVPGQLEQTQVVRGLLAHHATDPLPFNLIEGFDQPWKRALEGAMGGAWGLFDAQGRVRVRLQGPVTPDPHAWQWLVAAGLGGLVGLGWASRHARRLWPAWAWLLGGAAGAGLGLMQWQALVLWGRGPLEWGLGALTLTLSLLCSLAATSRLAGRLSAVGPAVRPGVVAAWGGGGARSAPWFALVQIGFLFAVATDGLGLVFDPRYRPLGWPTLATPALGLLGLALLGERLAAGAREERLLAAVCAGCALCIAVQEGPANTQALLYAALLLTLAAAILPGHPAAPDTRARGRSRARAASNTAGADQGVE